MSDPEARLFELLDRLDQDTDSVVTSVRQPTVLREALKAAVDAGMDPSANEAVVHAVRDRLEAFAQRRALEAHYERHPHARPSLADLTIAAAEMDGNSLAERPELLRHAADAVVEFRPDASSEDVLEYAAVLDSRRAAG